MAPPLVMSAILLAWMHLMKRIVLAIRQIMARERSTMNMIISVERTDAW